MGRDSGSGVADALVPGWLSGFGDPEPALEGAGEGVECADSVVDGGEVGADGAHDSSPYRGIVSQSPTRFVRTFFVVGGPRCYAGCPAK